MKVKLGLDSSSTQPDDLQLEIVDIKCLKRSISMLNLAMLIISMLNISVWNYRGLLFLLLCVWLANGTHLELDQAVV